VDIIGKINYANGKDRVTRKTDIKNFLLAHFGVLLNLGNC
jgi:hypothetical protein